MIASASRRRPCEISHRGDSGSRATIHATTSDGIPPTRNIACHPHAGTSHAPACPAAINPMGKIISYNKKNLPRPRACDSSLMYAAATGISPPIPIPWIKRNVNSVEKSRAVTHAKPITAMMATAMVALRTRPNRSAIQLNNNAPINCPRYAEEIR